MAEYDDTIAAIATPPGRGGIGVLRVSGPEVAAIAGGLAGGLPAPREAALRRFRDAAGQAIDHGLLLYFPAPHSYTGEHVLELQGHGGPVVMDLLLARALELGARLARPGEFSERAFLNGKLDLTQAEAVADLISSGTAEAARAAMGSLEGALSRRVAGLAEGLTGLRAYVESAIDFPEEEVDFLSEGQVAERLQGLQAGLDDLRAAASQGRLLQEGMTVVLAGRPNAGKSSLLNRLAGHEAAIVTDLPGTTRDLLRERVGIDGMPLHVLDTAGLGEGGDAVEREGVRRARAAMDRADRVLLVVDDREGPGELEGRVLAERSAGASTTMVLNKIDLSGRAPGAAAFDGCEAVAVSALTGAGLDALRRHLKACMGYAGSGGAFTARRRHLDALARCRDRLAGAARCLQGGAGELVAEELRLAQRALGEVTGEVSSEDLLDRIFASFCIGK